MPPPLSARASSVTEVAKARRLERATVHGHRGRPKAAVTAPSRTRCPTHRRPARTAALCIWGEVIVSAIAPHHQSHSLCLATPRKLPLAMAASLSQNG